MGPATDPERSFLEGVCSLIRHDRGVGNLLDQSRAEDGGRNAKDQIGVERIKERVEVFLPDATTGGVDPAPVRATADDEEIVDAAVRPAPVELIAEADLSDWAIWSKKERDRVPRAPGRGDSHLRVRRGRSAARRRLGMAANAAIEVEPWPESVRELFELLELGFASEEEVLFSRREPREHPSRSRRPGTHAGVARSELSPGRGGPGERDEHDRHEHFDPRHVALQTGRAHAATSAARTLRDSTEATRMPHQEHTNSAANPSACVRASTGGTNLGPSLH